MKARIKDITYSETGECLVTFIVSKREKDKIKALSDADADIKISKYKEKRSLDANAYAWVLMSELSSVTGIRTDDIYREYIRNVGGNVVTVCAEQDKADRICSDWENNGLGWQAVQFESKIQGCMNIRLYEGSSSFDTGQMSRLISMIKQDCEEQGIETATPEEIKNMISLWEAKQ